MAWAPPSADYCGCGACAYKRAKFSRARTHDVWAKATKYPGEKVRSSDEAPP